MRRIAAIIGLVGAFVASGCEDSSQVLGTSVHNAVQGAQFPDASLLTSKIKSGDPIYADLVLLKTAEEASQAATGDSAKAKEYYKQALLVGKLSCRSYIDGVAVSNRGLDSAQFGVNTVSTIVNGLLGIFGAGVGAFTGLNIGTNAGNNVLHFTQTEYTFDATQAKLEELITKNIQNDAEVTAGAGGANINSYQDAKTALINGMSQCTLVEIRYAIQTAIHNQAPGGTQPSPGSGGGLTLTANYNDSANPVPINSGVATPKVTVSDSLDDSITIQAVPAISKASDSSTGANLDATTKPASFSAGILKVTGAVSATYTLTFNNLQSQQSVNVTASGTKGGVTGQPVSVAIKTQ